MTASSQAGFFKIPKRVYTRRKTVMVARMGNNMIITIIGPALEAWRSMVGCWVAIPRRLLRDVFWVSGATLLLKGGMTSRGLREGGARHDVLNDGHATVILRGGRPTKGCICATGRAIRGLS